MKKLSISIFIAALTGLLFSSCSHFSDVSMTKRHYRNGYYIETYASGKPVQKQEVKQEEARSKETDLPELKPNTLVNNEATLTKGVENTMNQDGQIKKNRTAIYTMSHPTLNNSNLNADPDKELTVTQKGNKITRLEHRYEGDHHGIGGILWFLIVLLLILFLLNFILSFNLGGLVYIILVIALILLLFRLIGML